MDNVTDIISRLTASSPYLSTLIDKNPDIGREYSIIIESRSDKKKQDGGSVSLFGKYPFPAGSKTDELFLRIRHIKNYELAIIALKDFLLINTVPETLSQLSNLADFCIDWSVKSLAAALPPGSKISYERLCESIVIIGMGKLGGNELNISSDIDLIFLGVDAGLEDNLLRKELDTFLASLLDFLSKTSEEGFLYRVDMRLRPEGDIGPLIMGINNSLEYYKNRGRKWELQAMVKKRLVWGSDAVYNEFREKIDVLIYQHHQPRQILIDIRKIKNEIELKILRQNFSFNIKLSPGGIRDIEFIIQFLQLIHGIRYPEIRNSNSLAALSSLGIFHIITPEEFSTLHDGYIILRKIENILQLKDNTPEHCLPLKEGDIYNLFVSWKLEELEQPAGDYEKNFIHSLEKIMAKIRSIFTSLFDETIRYIELKDNIRSRRPDLPAALLDDHFLRMDSEYFLRFQEEEICRHIIMISLLNLDNPAQIDVEELGEERWKLCIVAFDYYYEFSKISGLISAYYLKIKSGESFTYSEYASGTPENPEMFYRRKKKQIYPYSSGENYVSLIYRRKIVCFLIVENLKSGGPEPDWNSFKRELNFILHCLETNKVRESEEFLNNKILSLIPAVQNRELGPLTPVEIDVDNESSAQYTILTIRSNDSFAFLYTFTNVLALNNYYIYKAEIDTIDEKAYDRLFILTRDGKKILEEDKVENLKIAVAFIKQYSSLLRNAVNPDKALHYFDELLSRILESGEKNELPILGQEDVQEKLATIFGIGDYFWEDFIRIQYTDMLPILNDPSLDISFSREELTETFKKIICAGKITRKNGLEDFSLLFNEWKDREMFRIDLRQILKKIDMIQFSFELTNLAEAVIELAVSRIEREMTESDSFPEVPPFALFGLGKLGGMELGYASDIEIMLIYDVPAGTENAYTADSYFEKMVQSLLRLIKSKREGIFEIDLNLRPYGKSSKLAVSLSSFIEYFVEGKAYYFEKQALVKLRPIVSGRTGGYICSEISKYRDNFVYGSGKPDIDALLALRQKQIASYIKDPSLINIKYSRGCLVDIEYLVQTLQIAYGGNDPSLREVSTLKALDSLYKSRVIDFKSWTGLHESYIFFRNLINTLRMVKGSAKDLNVYPENTIEFNYLVKRSFFVGIINEESSALLKEIIEKYRGLVTETFNNEIGRLRPGAF